MKKTVLTFLTMASLLVLQTAAAQSAVELRPETSNGFLLLNSTDYPTVTSWEITIFKTTYTDGVPTTTTEKTETLTDGVNFTSIAQEYYAGGSSSVDYSYTVKGYGTAKAPVTTFGPERLCLGCPPPNMELLKTWKCKASTYAWSISAFHNTNWQGPEAGNYYLWFSEAVDYLSTDNGGFVIPYYEWMTGSEEAAICSTPESREFHGLTDNDCYTVNAEGSTQRIITRDALETDHLLGAECDHITGHIFGVQKYLGPWTNRAGMLINLGTTNVSDLSVEQIVNAVTDNDWFDLDDTLECDSCENVPEWHNEGWWGTGYQEAPWYAEIPTTDPPVDHQDGGLWGLIGTMSQYAGGESFTPVKGNVKWYENMRSVQVSRIDQPGLNLLIERSKLFDGDDQIGYPSITLEPGLYLVEFIHKDQTGLPLFYRVATEQVYTIQQKDLFDATVYPVPITGNSFSMDLKAKAKMTVAYTLYGPSMEVLHTQNISLSKNHTKTVTVSNGAGAATAWPSGTFIHHFAFPDGSEVSITTIKL